MRNDSKRVVRLIAERVIADVLDEALKNGTVHKLASVGTVQWTADQAAAHVKEYVLKLKRPR